MDKKFIYAKLINDYGDPVLDDEGNQLVVECKAVILPNNISDQLENNIVAIIKGRKIDLAWDTYCDERKDSGRVGASYCFKNCDKNQN